MLVALALPLAGPAAGRASPGTAPPPRAPPPVLLGGWTVPALGALVVLVGVSLGVPLCALAYWLIKGSSTTLPSASVFGATLADALGVALVAASPTPLYGRTRGTRPPPADIARRCPSASQWRAAEAAGG
ncbi:hypothetical protein [Kitasatospora cinereorecta]|uniref:SLC41A/MgtE integral membrane domain-containing protein n=1 Tax=Kitasatospora cinereorecta TaxID=285560 RepID=A0ABW0V7R3_9ACTN